MKLAYVDGLELGRMAQIEGLMELQNVSLLAEPTVPIPSGLSKTAEAHFARKDITVVVAEQRRSEEHIGAAGALWLLKEARAAISPGMSRKLPPLYRSFAVFK